MKLPKEVAKTILVILNAGLHRGLDIYLLYTSHQKTLRPCRHLKMFSNAINNHECPLLIEKMSQNHNENNIEGATEDNDLIFDAKESEEEELRSSSKSQRLKNCLQSCCPLLLESMYDLGKSKVKDVVTKKTISALNAVQDEAYGAQGDPEAEIANVLERIDDIRKPVKDHRNYRYIELKNCLKVLLVSDPTTKTSGAALDIKIGSFHDPVHLQGLAHLCEHVLFTGSELFPNESYSAFLGQRGGTSNAFTTSEHTNFHFEVPCEHFVDALIRFVSFIQCPILRESSIQNELEIIQSEHEKNKWNDVWRTNQVERATANPNHVFSHFSTGTRQTLTVEKGAERNLRYELFQFYKQNYSANIMCLCLIHTASIEELEELAETHLLGFLNKNSPERIWPNRPFKPKQMRTKIFVVPVKEVCHVNLTFPMEDISSWYRSGAAGQVAQLIGHKGKNGLYALLRSRGWAHHLVASHKSFAKGFSLFLISIQLTESGERFIDDVISVVFQFINLLKASGPLQWFYEELKYLTVQQFEQQEADRPQNYASNIAQWLHTYTPEEILAADYLLYEWKPELILKIYAYLSPDNVRVTILTKKAQFFSSNVEPHFGTAYHVEKISNDVLDQWHQCGLNPDLHLPKPNELINKDPKIVNIGGPNDPKTRENAMPELFLNMDRIRFRAWHLPNTKLNVPKAYTFLRFQIRESAQRQSAKLSCLCSLLAFVIRDCLSEDSYEGQLAGLFYILRPLKDGLELEVRGMSGNQDLFLKKILNVMFQSGGFWDEVLTEERFKQVQILHRNGLASGDAIKLKIQAKTILSHVLNPGCHLRDSRLAALSQLTVDDLKKFAKEFLLKHHLDCFFYGNLTIEMANQMTDLIIDSRKQFLEQYSQFLEILPSNDDQLVLEDWFRNDPVHCIIRLEDSIHAKLNQPEPEVVVEIPEDGNIIQDQNQDLQLQDETSAFISVENGIDIQGTNSLGVCPPQQNIEVEMPKNPADLISNENIEDATDKIQEKDDAKDFEEMIEETEYSIPKAEYPDSRHVVIVHNEIQSSSCVLYYLECANNTPKDASTLELFFHLVQVKLITSLKHVVHLGYVVGCDIRKIKDRLGFRIIVESQYPLCIVHKTIEDSLEDLDDFLAHMDEKDFEMSKAAVMSVKEDSRSTLRDQAQAHWKEIAEDTYDFARHSKELACMSQLDLFDVRSFYRQWMHSKASERRNLILSISPDPTLNRLENNPHISHWTLNQMDQFRALMTPLPKRIIPNEWYQSVFENTDQNVIFEPPTKFLTASSF